MKNALNKIIYLALGESYVSQAIFSLLTVVEVYRGRRPDMEVVVYTDSTATFNDLRRFLDITPVEVSDELLREMKGVHWDILRAKIMAMRETMEMGRANLVYVDTDTIFLRKIEHLFAEIGSVGCFCTRKSGPCAKGGSCILSFARGTYAFNWTSAPILKWLKAP